MSEVTAIYAHLAAYDSDINMGNASVASSGQLKLEKCNAGRSKDQPRVGLFVVSLR